MKRFILFVSLTIISVLSFGQDVIVKKNSETIKVKVTEVNQDNIKFKKWDNLDGPTYTLLKSEINTILYQNGDAEVFVPSEPQSNDSYDSYNPYNRLKEKVDVDAVINDRTLFFKGECITNSSYSKYMFYDEQTKQSIDLSKSQFADYLKTHDYELYKKYKTSYDKYISGVVFTCISACSIELASLLFLLNTTSGEDHTFDDPVNKAGASFGIIGVACAAVGIPLLIKGNASLKKIPSMYNEKYVNRNRTAMTWSLGATNNGVAFRFNF